MSTFKIPTTGHLISGCVLRSYEGYNAIYDCSKGCTSEQTQTNLLNAIPITHYISIPWVYITNPNLPTIYKPIEYESDSHNTSLLQSNKLEDIKFETGYYLTGIEFMKYPKTTTDALNPIGGIRFFTTKAIENNGIWVVDTTKQKEYFYGAAYFTNGEYYIGGNEKPNLYFANTFTAELNSRNVSNTLGNYFNFTNIGFFQTPSVMSIEFSGDPVYKCCMLNRKCDNINTIKCNAAKTAWCNANKTDDKLCNTEGYTVVDEETFIRSVDDKPITNKSTISAFNNNASPTAFTNNASPTAFITILLIFIILILTMVGYQNYKTNSTMINHMYA